MPLLRDEDVAIWVCPHGTTSDVIEYKAQGPLPNAKVCGAHGEAYLRRCPNSECSSPVYHPSDLDENFHKPCGATIPWAEPRRSYSDLFGYEPLNSRLIGTGSYLGTVKPAIVPELTAQERQDLIAPPSERLPGERVRVPMSKQASGEGEPPREAQRWLEKATEPMKATEPLLGPTYRDLKRTTWDQLEHGQITRIDPPTPQRLVKFLTDPVYRGMQSAIEKFVMGLVLTALAAAAALALLLLRSALQL